MIVSVSYIKSIGRTANIPRAGKKPGNGWRAIRAPPWDNERLAIND